MFAKTKMCRFYILGKCTKGLECPYAHDQSDLRNMPDLRCTKICKTLLQTGVCNDKSCTFAHGKEDLRSSGAFQRTKLCRNMQFGRCPRGDKCSFAHSKAELQTPKTLKGLKLPPGLGAYDDGDEESTCIGSGSGSGDSNSSEYGSIAASSNTMFEPAYVHIGGLTDSEAFHSQHLVTQPMPLQTRVASHALGDTIGATDLHIGSTPNYMNSLADAESSILDYLRVMNELELRTKKLMAEPPWPHRLSM